MSETCQNCRYWAANRWNTTEADGEHACCRFPPVPVGKGQYNTDSVYPKTQYYDWCGEWKESNVAGNRTTKKT